MKKIMNYTFSDTLMIEKNRTLKKHRNRKIQNAYNRWRYGFKTWSDVRGI